MVAGGLGLERGGESATAAAACAASKPSASCAVDHAIVTARGAGGASAAGVVAAGGVAIWRQHGLGSVWAWRAPWQSRCSTAARVWQREHAWLAAAVRWRHS